MNKEMDQAVKQALARGLGPEGWEFDLVAIPTRGSRQVRLQSIEEAIQDFENEGSGGGFLVRVKAAPKKPLVSVPSDDDDEIRLPDGKLNGSFLFQNAQLLFHAGDFAAAATIYRTLLRENEKADQACYWLARCYESQGKDEEACGLYERAIQFKANLENYQRLAALHIRRRRDVEGARTLERAALLTGLDPSTRFEILKATGNCWNRAEEPQKAETAYRAALQIAPQSDAVLANLGTLFLKQGRTGEAKLAFQRATAANSKNDRAFAGLGSCLYSEGEKRQAHDAFVRALELKLENSTAVFYLVKCAFELKIYATAARILNDYIEHSPVNIPLLYSLAGLQYHLGRVDEAQMTVTRILMMSPDHTGALELRRLLERIGTGTARGA